jgi:DNA-directed RNA polymerase subunit RPC12/RpoP
MQRNPVVLGRDDEECSLTEGGSDCLCDECGKPFQKPLLATVMSQGSSERYYACPRCLTKVGEMKTKEKEESKEAAPTLDLRKSVARLENDVKCQHFLGYLKRRPKDTPIPDGCLTCGRMVECLYIQ